MANSQPPRQKKNERARADQCPGTRRRVNSGLPHTSTVVSPPERIYSRAESTRQHPLASEESAHAHLPHEASEVNRSSQRARNSSVEAAHTRFAASQGLKPQQSPSLSRCIDFIPDFPDSANQVCTGTHKWHCRVPTMMCRDMSSWLLLELKIQNLPENEAATRDGSC